MYWVMANVFQVDIGRWFGWGGGDGVEGTGGVPTVPVPPPAASESAARLSPDGEFQDASIPYSYGNQAATTESYAPSSSSAPSSASPPLSAPSARAPITADSYSYVRPSGVPSSVPSVGRVTVRGSSDGGVQMQQGLSERSAEALLELMSRME